MVKSCQSVNLYEVTYLIHVSREEPSPKKQSRCHVGGGGPFLTSKISILKKYENLNYAQVAT